MHGDLTVTLRNRRPIELLDLTASLSGLAQEYLRHLEEKHPEDAAADVRLYVEEIRSGSVVATLMAVSPQLLQGLSYVNSVVTFSKHLKSAYEYLSAYGGGAAPEPELSRPTLQNLADILEPVAKDSGAQLNIGTVNGNVQFVINSRDANAAQNAISKLLKRDSPSAQLHEKVLLYWYQARADAGSKSGDKGIIESISANPVKVICETEVVKAQMVLGEVNPFKEAYVVDVVVETINGRPALYKIVRLHERFDRE
jgi:hypothetical protein